MVACKHGYAIWSLSRNSGVFAISYSRAAVKTTWSREIFGSTKKALAGLNNELSEEQSFPAC